MSLAQKLDFAMVCERPPAAFGGSPPVSGGEWLYCPPWKGGVSQSGRGSLTRHVEIDFLSKAPMLI